MSNLEEHGAEQAAITALCEAGECNHADCKDDQPEYLTRADLMRHPAFADLDTDSEGNPCVWQNHYYCDHAGVSGEPESAWQDEWSCECDDDCLICGQACESAGADWLPTCVNWSEIGAPDDEAYHLWASLPECGGQDVTGEDVARSVKAKLQDDLIDPLFAEATVRTLLASMTGEQRREFFAWVKTVDEAMTDPDNEIVTRSAPRWAWETIDEILDIDRSSPVFSLEFRERIGAAVDAMALACERGDGEPISREDV